MVEFFADIRKSWQTVAANLGCSYSDTPSTNLPDEAKPLFRPPVLTFSHRNWIVEFKAAPPTFVNYTVVIDSYFTPTKEFDVSLHSTETFMHVFCNLTSPIVDFFDLFQKQRELDARRQPLEVEVSSTGIQEIDRHYFIKSFDCQHPTLIFGDPRVRAALISLPKTDLHIIGFPDMQDEERPDRICSIKFWRASDVHHIEAMVHLYTAVLDRLHSLELIDAEWSKTNHEKMYGNIWIRNSI